MSTDLELLDRWRADDQEAGNALFKRHFASLYQFSFCVVACELLYGRRPFAGDSLDELGAAALSGELVELVDRKIPRSVRAVLLRGLAADPARRFVDMPELLAALQAGFERRGRRRRWLLGATLGCAIAAPRRRRPRRRWGESAARAPAPLRSAGPA
ncbi:hypothetical protein [Enhygromyxa salina]|uniref:hypothetical protein n=1 Tax=Enhygromyxa salina TaxID=215803 RepID=UPI000D03E9C0|nr:hypothetical protein [Enhygromyxa salina]